MEPTARAYTGRGVGRDAGDNGASSATLRGSSREVDHGSRLVPVRVVVARTDSLRAGFADGVLSEAERDRVLAYRRAEDRILSAAAAHLVRAVAGRALGVLPEEVVVTRRCPGCGGPHGAPFVDGAPLLSVSHCDGFAVVASCALPVGVDVEPVDRAGVRSAAVEMLGPDEHPCSEDAGLLRTWVRKEAVVKATGVGLTIPLADVQVTSPHDPPAVVRYAPRPGLALALADVPLEGAFLSVAVVTGQQLEVSVEDGVQLIPTD